MAGRASRNVHGRATGSLHDAERGRRQVSRVAVACVACLAMAVACSRDVPRASGGDSFAPVAMPDISRATPDVQAQLRAQYAEMRRRLDSPVPADRAAAYGDMGKLFVATEFYAAAAESFADASRLAPGDMRWPYYAAQVARLANDPAKAADFFEQALARQPDYVPSLVWLAEMRLAQNRTGDAKALLLKAQALAPREAAVAYGLGRVALEEHDYATAVTQLETALAIVPSASRVQYPLAMAYRGLGNVAQTEAHLRLRGENDLPPADPLMGEIGGLLKNAAAYETRGGQAIDE